MKILLLGNSGQVGHEIDQLLNPKLPLQAGAVPGGGTAAGFGGAGAYLYDAFTSLDYPDVDLADPDSVAATIRHHNPTLIVNAAAYTAVDQAESEEPQAHAVNAEAPGIMAEEMKKRGGALVHFSTDYVFDGEKPAPYTEDDTPHPLGAYGRTKLAGERAIAAAGIPHVIFRTSWIYGTRGKNFLLKILRLAREREELRVVDDQHGAPTWSRDLARATLNLIRTDRRSGPVPRLILDHPGLYHLTGTGSTSWYGFAKAIVDLDPGKADQTLKSLVPISSEEHPAPAPRPKNSRLDCTKAGKLLGIELPPWDESLKQAMAEPVLTGTDPETQHLPEP